MELYPYTINLIRFFFIGIAVIGLVFFVIIPLFRSGLPELPPRVLQRKNHTAHKNLEAWQSAPPEKNQGGEENQNKKEIHFDENLKKATDVVEMAKKDPQKTANIIQKWLKDS